MRVRLHVAVSLICFALVQTASAQTVATRESTPGPASSKDCSVDAIVDSAMLARALAESRPRDTATVWLNLRLAQGAVLATIPDTATDKSLSQELLDLTSKHARKPAPRLTLPAKLRVKLGEEPSFLLQRPPNCVARATK
jgi:hypothetical protein